LSKRFLIILAVIAATFFGLVLINKKDTPTTSNTNTPVGSSHIQNENAAVRLVEYGDFQCPACGAYFSIIKQLEAHFGDKLGFQFINYPLVSIHPNAMSAHRAAEAAHRQGKFWEMHDLLYQNQNSWSSSKSAASIFEGYAQDLGLDLAKYRQDLESSEIQALISADIKAGQGAKITATPGFVLDGKKIEDNPRDLESFTKLIDEAIAAKQQ
jgi:protein-disulfide isomerase